MLLNFKGEKQDGPCPEFIREQLLDFHEDLMRHCGQFHSTKCPNPGHERFQPYMLDSCPNPNTHD